MSLFFVHWKQKETKRLNKIKLFIAIKFDNTFIYSHSSVVLAALLANAYEKEPKIDNKCCKVYRNILEGCKIQ